MKEQPVYAFAKWQVKEESLSEVISLLTGVVEHSRNEEGNLFYKVHQSLSDTHTLLLFEGYRDEKALDLHRGSEHFKNLVIKQIVPLLANREVILSNEILTGL